MENTQVSEEKQRLVAFQLGAEKYGVDINHIREIIPLQAITTVPGVPGYVRGITNLRGRVITVLDLRVKLGLPATPPTASTCIVIVEHAAEPLGLIVDDVSEVLQVDEEAIDHPSRVVSSLNSDHMTGVARFGDELLVILDLEAVLRHPSPHPPGGSFPL